MSRRIRVPAWTYLPKTDHIPDLGGFYYLASPYTGHHASIAKADSAPAERMLPAVAQVADVLYWLTRRGITAVSPVLNYHKAATDWGSARLMAYDHQSWWAHNERIMEASCGLLVATLSGWETSSGVQAEIEWFERTDKPVFILETVKSYDGVPEDELWDQAEAIAS